MAHTKSGGTTRLGRDSNPKYRGIKRFAGERVQVGDIIVRQSGLTVLAGANVRRAKDYTLFAERDGVVTFSEKRKERFDGSRRRAKVASVLAPAGAS